MPTARMSTTTTLSATAAYTTTNKERRRKRQRCQTIRQALRVAPKVSLWPHRLTVDPLGHRRQPLKRLQKRAQQRCQQRRQRRRRRRRRQQQQKRNQQQQQRLQREQQQMSRRRAAARVKVFPAVAVAVIKRPFSDKDACAHRSGRDQCRRIKRT